MKKREHKQAHTSIIRAFLFATCLAGVLMGIILSLLLDIGLTKLKKITKTELPSCIIPHSNRHHAFKPLCSGFNEWGEEAFEVSTNSLGFRDKYKRIIAKESATRRVLFLGDSFTDGAVPWDETIIGQLSKTRPDIEFLNGGVGSYSPTNYLSVATELLESGYKLDLVVVLLDISDIQDEAAIYQDSKEEYPANLTFIEPQFERMSLLPAIVKYLLENTLFTRSVIQYINKKFILHGFFYLPTSWSSNLFDNPRSAWPYKPQDNINSLKGAFEGYAPLGVEGGIKKAYSKMSKLSALLSSHNVPLFLVVYPWPGQLAHDSQSSKVVSLWRDWCNGNCMQFIDTFPDFFIEKNHCPVEFPGCWYNNLFIYGDIHYNTKGNSIVSKKIAPLL
jgi:hypothetical protein